MKKTFLFFITFSLILSEITFPSTYHLSKNGSDNNTGTSWSSAWKTIAKVNQSVSGGDTLYIGTGIWREKLKIKAGSFSDRTVYACSSFAETNAQGEFHFAQIYGSDALGGWIQFSGNVYKVNYTLQANFSSLWDASQSLDNEQMVRQTSLASVNSPGKWYYNAGIIYAWVSGGNNPSTHKMEITRDIVVQTWADGSYIGQDHVTLYGLRLKYGMRSIVGGILEMMEISPYDSLFIDHCHLSHISWDQGENPALIYSGWSASRERFGQFNRVRACSLGYAYALSPTYQSLGNKGSAIDHYSQSDYLIDSSTFYGYFKQGAIYWKAAQYDPSPWCERVVIRYNKFTNYHGFGVEFFGWTRFNEVYGNLFIGLEKGITSRRSHVVNGGFEKIYNNTFIDCLLPLFNNSSPSDGINYQVNNEFKYNVIYSDNYQAVTINSFGISGNEFINVDSNLYFNMGGILELQYPSGIQISQNQWQSSVGMDTHSKFNENPGFTDIANNDFNRLSTAGEMDRTYGDQIWSRYGALQPTCTPSVSPLHNSPATGIMAAQQPLSLSWSPVESAISYKLQVSGFRDFSFLIRTQQSLSTIAIIAGLDEGYTYFWRVQTRDSCGWGAWSDYWSFATTCPIVPKEPSVASITVIIDNLFGFGTPINCLDVSDFDGSGGAAPTPADITVADITALIDYLFVSGNPPKNMAE